MVRKVVQVNVRVGRDLVRKHRLSLDSSSVFIIGVYQKGGRIVAEG